MRTNTVNSHLKWEDNYLKFTGNNLGPEGMYCMARLIHGNEVIKVLVRTAYSDRQTTNHRAIMRP